MDTKTRFALPLLAVLALAGCGENPDELFERAQESYAAQDYRDARLKLITGLDDRPGNKAMLALLVRAQVGLGDPDGAERTLERLERAGGALPELQTLKARVALLRRRPQQALQLIGDDNSVESWRVRAEAQLALGNDNAARKAFESGMAAGDDIGLAASYARLALQGHEMVLAQRIIQRMRGISPETYEEAVLAGDLAAAQGQSEKAAAAYRAVIDNYPDRVGPMLALANQLDILGRIDEASKIVEQAEKIAPDNSEIEDLKYQFLAQKGEWQKIRLSLQGRESSLDPNSALGMRYAEALLRLGFAQQARIMFKRASLMLPGNPYTRMMLGEAQLACGDPEGAWATLEPLSASVLARPDILQTAEKAARAIDAPEAAALRARLEPARLKATMPLLDRGDAAMMQQDWKTVLEVYGKLLGQGSDPEVLKRLSLAASRLGRASEAIGYADRALAAFPDNPDYLHLAGLVRLDGGQDLARARRLLEAAAEADPRNAVMARDFEKAKAAAG